MSNDTQVAIASGSKGFTALAVISLVVGGQLAIDTNVRSLLGRDLPLIDDDVTVEHLLAHTSGIGDYLDEDALDDVNAFVLRVPVHELATTEQYLRALDGYPQKHPPGSRFSYSNSGYVVLALIAERVAGMPFHDLVRDRVSRPAGMGHTAYLRSDELPGGTAIGYLDTDGLRTNVFHLPVRGSGDGGAFSTVADIDAFWDALFAGAIVPLRWVERMTAPSGDESASSGGRYGLGFWLEESGSAVLEGSDAGVSFRTVHDPRTGVTHTVMSNSTAGAWPVARLLNERFSR